MRLRVTVTDFPIVPPPPGPADDPETREMGEIGEIGARLEFSGIVRPTEAGRPIEGLRYEVYQPMAEAELTRAARALAAEFPCHNVEIIHRVGWVPAGETSLWVRVESPHRREALGFLAEFIDRLKRDVPIWKSA